MDRRDYEDRLRKKCIKIIRNNNIEQAIEKISNLKFQGKNLGKKKAKNICKIYVSEFINYCGQNDKYNYMKELNETCAHL